LHQSRKGKDIILHAGGHSGFIPNALVIFKSNQKTGNYHNEMNGENYTCWLKEKLIPNLEPNSVLVTDNAPYHNIQKNKAPTSNQKGNNEELVACEKHSILQHNVKGTAL
jgi:hypothetical protein